MANKKYDYSDELSPSAEPYEIEKAPETEESMAVSVEEMRRQWIEQRNDALANEFHKLKPEIADAHRQLSKLIDGIGAYAGTMQNLHDLLKISFPIRFTENDRRALLKEISAIADNAILQIRDEREKANKDIRCNDNRISMTQTTFWCLIALLMTLVSFFAVVVFANMKQLHAEILTEIIIVYVSLIATTFVITGCIYKIKQS